jgi:hypothetical protein
MALKPGTTDMEHDPQLSADYRVASEEMPPASLDQRIRAAARREVGAGPRRQSRWSVWQMPMSLAAVVLLSVTLVLMMREEGVDRVEPDMPPPAVEAAAPPVASEPAAQSRLAEAPRLTPGPQAPPPTHTGALQAQPAPVAADSAPPVMGKAQTVAEPPASFAASPLREESAAAERSVAPARDTARPMLRSAPAATAVDAAAGPAPRVAAPATVMSAPVPERVLWQDLVNDAPEKWVQRIVEWRRTGRTADADALTAEFRRRFPDHPLPSDAVAQ